MYHYYAAYGMNTNKAGMASRCPTAEPLYALDLDGWRFRFAGCADVVRETGTSVNVALWKLTDNDLASLDALEGYPHYYDRVQVPVEHEGEIVFAWIYTMQPGHEDRTPGISYWNCLVEGYTDFGMSHEQLDRAHVSAELAAEQREAERNYSVRVLPRDYYSPREVHTNTSTNLRDFYNNIWGS